MSLIKFGRHLRFRVDELRDALVVSVVFAVIVSLGYQSTGDLVTRSEWMSYLLVILFFSLVMMGVYIFSQKAVGIMLGYDVKFQIWYLGLLVGVMFGFLSKGAIYLLIPGAVFVKTIPSLRIGKYFSGYTFREDAWIHFLGLAFLLVFAMALKPFAAASPIFGTFIAMCIAVALFGMLPLPYLAGGKILFSSKFLYLFSVGYLIVFSAMLLYSTVLLTLFTSVVGGLLFMLCYHFIRD